jgi:serine/threonine-protein kinase
MADALATLHDMGIVHRDVKPQNIMLLRGMEHHAKLIDFGFAKVPMEQITTEGGGLLGGDKRIEDPDTVFGTMGYLAPEAASGMDAVDARSDLYALGAIFYEMLAGRKPFEAASNSELFQHHRLSPVPRLSDRAPGVPVPTAVEAVVMRMLEKSPAKRYQSGRDVFHALEQALPRSRSIQPAIMIEVARPAPRWGRGIAIVLLLGLLGGIVWFALKRQGILGDFDTAATSASEAPETRKQEVDGLGASAWTARLLAAPASKDWEGGAKALAALAELDGRALQNSEVATAAAAIAAEAARSPDRKATADEVFELLAQRFGGEGLDALYTLVDSKAGDAPRRAMAHLREARTLERASPALRITVELRDAPCEFKHGLFERAGSLGDQRTLAVMTDIQNRPCKSARDPCCYRTDDILAKAIAALKARDKKN